MRTAVRSTTGQQVEVKARPTAGSLYSLAFTGTQPDRGHGLTPCYQLLVELDGTKIIYPEQCDSYLFLRYASLYGFKAFSNSFRGW